MKKSIFVATMAVLSMNSFADRFEMESQVMKLAKKVNRMTQANADTLSRKQLRDLQKHLKLSMGILKGRAPVPTPTPRPIYKVCSQDFTDVFQQAFTQVKSFAYSSAGLNMTSSGATSYAQEFTSTHSCDDAQKMMANVKRLKNFAYVSSGLNMTSTGAKNYALNKWQSFCEDFPIESEFKKHFQFAYSSSGLNMTSSGATKYAQQQIEPTAFSCGNIF